MRKGATIIAAALLICLAGTQSGFAVGSEHYDSSGVPQNCTPVNPQTVKGFFHAVHKAGFVERYPAIIDEVAFFVRDVLSQFGIAEHTNP